MGGIDPTSWLSFKLIEYSFSFFSVFFITGGIVYIVWLYRAAANVHAVRPEAMTFSPGWVVGWNFIPIAFFWMPYQAVKQIWQASHNVQHPDQVPVPGMLRWWWGFWLVTLILNCTGEIDGSEFVFMDFSNGDVMLLIALCAAIVGTCFSLFRIIREITRAQAKLASNTAGIFE